MQRRTTSITLSEAALELLRKHSQKENRTPSNFLENLLANHFAVDVPAEPFSPKTRAK
jgi:hypothetical protein